jgi:hypothetical protein
VQAEAHRLNMIAHRAIALIALVLPVLVMGSGKACADSGDKFETAYKSILAA